MGEENNAGGTAGAGQGNASQASAGQGQWKTAITKIQPNRIWVKGYRLDQLMGKVSFPETIYLILKGELPSPAEAKILDAILTAAIDHGATPISTLAARNVASGGASLSAAIAAGVMAIGPHHGGAIEGAMKTFEKAVAAMKEGLSAAEAAARVLDEAAAKGVRLPGFGHRIHTDDPRTKRLLAMADELGLSDRYVEAARALEIAINERSGKRLPLNVDGATAALLGEMGFPPRMANAFFIMARVPGLAAHVLEEMTRERPVRKISPTEHEYDGPPEREIAGG